MKKVLVLSTLVLFVAMASFAGGKNKKVEKKECAKTATSCCKKDAAKSCCKKAEAKPVDAPAEDKKQ
jgi:hypothetical protein